MRTPARLIATGLAVVVLSIWALFASSCGGSQPPQSGVRIAVIGNADSLSPIYDRSPAARIVQNVVFRSFLGWSADGAMRTEWAANIPSARAGTFRGSPYTGSYTVTLRPDARWSDGSPLDNDDFLFTYRLLTHPLFKKEHASWTSYIRRFGLVGNSLTFLFNRTDERDALDLLPLSRRVLEPLLNSSPLGFADIPFHQKPMGNGPYMISRRTSNGVELERNPFYAPRPAKLERLTIQFYPDAAEAWSALNRGLVDVVNEVPPESIGGSGHDPAAVGVSLAPGPVLTAVVFNTRRAPLNDVHLRQALAHAVDRDGLQKSLGPERAVTAESWLQATRFSYIPSFRGYGGNVKQAERCLRASRWAAAGGGVVPAKKPAAEESPVGTGTPGVDASPGRIASPTAAPSASPRSTPSGRGRNGGAKLPGLSVPVQLTILYDTDNPAMATTVTALLNSWERIGLKAVPKGRPHESYLAELHQGAFTVALQQLDVYPWTQPWSYFAQESVPTETNNFRGDNVAGWSSPQSQKLLARIAAEASPAAAAQLMHEHERVLATEVPVLPLYFTPLATAARSGLLGLLPRSFGEICWNVEEWSWK